MTFRDDLNQDNGWEEVTNSSPANSADEAILTQLTAAPTGVAGHVMLDCSANPYDLRPALTVYTSMIQDRAKKLKTGQKLVPTVGEIHNLSAHPTLFTGLAIKLHQIFNDRLLVSHCPSSYKMAQI